MRYLRIVMVCATAAGALVVPSVAAAQISSISIDQAQLGAQGASVTVSLTVQCDSGWNLEFVNVNVAQKSGRFLAQGFGSAFWGVPCVGPGTIVIPVTNSSFVAFRKGSAVVTANVAVQNEAPFILSAKTASQTIKITKNPISYIDPLGHSAVRYRARLK
jgi:hypothetical protein